MSLVHSIDREIHRFEHLAATAGRTPGLQVEQLGEFAYLLRGGQVAPASAGDKDIALTLLGLTHGNEFAGAAILSEILAQVLAGAVRLDGAVAFVLGNPWAARENKRFLERDLNRSFNRSSASTHEERRALALTPVLDRSALLVDFHQTSRASDRAFFIFPYAASSLTLARAMAPRLAVVTHWGKPFSAEGMCTDEYVNSRGGTGVSLEVGQNGLDPYQIAVGVEAGLWAMRLAAGGRASPVWDRSRDHAAELFTWAEIVPWPEHGLVELAPHWQNFTDVRAGEALGTVDGKPLVAQHSGKMLFPKYLSREQQAALASRPTELCRILRPLAASELPAGR